MNSIPMLPRAAAFSILALAAAVLAGCSDGRSATAPAVARPTAVGVVELRSEPVTLTTELSGRTSAPLVAEIRPQVGGIVKSRSFTEGQRVRAGQVLYRIDPASYEAAYASAQAAVAKAEATVESARLTAQRRAELVKIEAISQQDSQDAQAAQKQAEAELAAARAALRSAQIDLARTSIASPIAGVVDVSTVTPGALVTAAQTTALTTVRQIDPIQVDITQSSAEVLRLKREMAEGKLQGAGSEAPVALILEDGSTYAHAGKLSVAGVSVNAGTGMVTLRAVFPNPDGLLLPGMYVRAQLPTARSDAALLVPQQAVSRNAAGQASVLVVDANDKVHSRVIVAERAVGNRWLVNSGLVAGERVIVEGSQKVKAGDTVQAQPIAAAWAGAPKPAATPAVTPKTTVALTTR
ncbi:MAG: efflux RND transporter periplasmic adaptor subunit [Burkholderiales bacterium]|nr:efflux RND transporter periplasmic adaptor subunit [Burkholderiales bacterium]